MFKLVHDWLRNEENGRWMLVIDNAGDAAVLSPGGEGEDEDALKQHLSIYIFATKQARFSASDKPNQARGDAGR